MTVDPDDPGTESPQLSLETAAARNLATTTKSTPQMQGITSRWLLRVLPWVETRGGAYRVTRRLSYRIGDGRVEFTNGGAAVQVIPAELTEIPFLRGHDDADVLTALAATLLDDDDVWGFTAKAATAATVLKLGHKDFDKIVGQNESLAAHIDAAKRLPGLPQDKAGQAEIALAAGHPGEPVLPGTFVDYELSPREYELSVAQTVLRIHTRVADLDNEPMNQTEQQLKLTIQARARGARGHRPASDRPSRRGRAGPVGAVHCNQRAGGHQLPRHGVLPGRRARARRARGARGLPGRQVLTTPVGGRSWSR